MLNIRTAYCACTPSRWALRFAAALALGIPISTQSNALADDSPHYDAVFTMDSRLPSCPGEQTFLSMLHSHLRAPLLDPQASRVLRVNVQQSKAGGYSIDVITENRDGTKIDSEHVDYPRDVCCFQVVYNAAFMAAVQIGAFTPNAPPPARETKLAHCAAEKSQTPEPSKTPIKPDKPTIMSRRPLFQIGAGPIVAIGFTPEIAVGANVGVAARWPRFSLGLDMHATLPIETYLEGATLVEMTAFSTSITPCFRPGPFLLCGIAMGGFLRTSVVEQTYPDVDHMVFAGAGGRIGFELPLIAQWTARFDMDLVILGTGSQTTVANRADSWLMENVTGNVGANVFWTF